MYGDCAILLFIVVSSTARMSEIVCSVLWECDVLMLSVISATARMGDLCDIHSMFSAVGV